MSEPSPETPAETVRVSLAPEHWRLSWFRTPDAPGVSVTPDGVVVDLDTAAVLLDAAKRSGIELHVEGQPWLPDAVPAEGQEPEAAPEPVKRESSFMSATAAANAANAGSEGGDTK